jgi:acyl carrier protein
MHNREMPLEGVIRIVREVLVRREIDPSRSFGDLGGDSLTAVHVISLIEEAFKVTIPFEGLIDAPDLATVAELVEQAQRAQRRCTRIISGTGGTAGG